MPSNSLRGIRVGMFRCRQGPAEPGEAEPAVVDFAPTQNRDVDRFEQAKTESDPSLTSGADLVAAFVMANAGHPGAGQAGHQRRTRGRPAPRDAFRLTHGEFQFFAGCPRPRHATPPDPIADSCAAPLRDWRRTVPALGHDGGGGVSRQCSTHAALSSAATPTALDPTQSKRKCSASCRHAPWKRNIQGDNEMLPFGLP